LVFENLLEIRIIIKKSLKIEKAFKLLSSSLPEEA